MGYYEEELMGHDPATLICDRCGSYLGVDESGMRQDCEAAAINGDTE
jgi:hypothetical protein